MTASARIPLFLLTGFLGSGKTTLLNAALREPALANTAVVVNEFGATEGLVTISDLMSTVIGNVLLTDANALVVQREDGSWLIDGLLPIDELKEKLGIVVLPDDEPGNFHTVGGFMLFQMGRIPRKADAFECVGWRFEVVDMDKNRVDEVLAKKLT